MADYIDRKKLLNKITNQPIHYIGGVKGYLEIKKIINDMPSVDAVEQKHGHWIEKTNDVELELICSNCKNGYIEADKDWKYRDRYCRWCGAKMDEVTDDE